jgi:hypothetical protein
MDTSQDLSPRRKAGHGTLRKTGSDGATRLDTPQVLLAPPGGRGRGFGPVLETQNHKVSSGARVFLRCLKAALSNARVLMTTQASRVDLESLQPQEVPC